MIWTKKCEECGEDITKSGEIFCSNQCKPILKMWGCGPMWKSHQDEIRPLNQEMKDRAERARASKT